MIFTCARTSSNMRITRQQLRNIIREALETLANPDITFRIGDVVDVSGSDIGLCQIIGIEGAYARVKTIGSMLDGPVETLVPLSRLIRSNDNA